MSERVFIVGAGKVGRGLAHAFRAAGVQVLGVHARTPREGATSSGGFPRSITEANVIMIAVTDAAINDVCLALASAARGKDAVVARGTIILYTSGTVTPPALTELRALGCPCGTFHPLAPFSTAERGAMSLQDGWVGIDGDAIACAASRRLAAVLGARTMNIPANAKPAYHAAAVMASNFPVVLASLASQMLIRSGIEEHAAEQVAQRLMAAAVANLEHGSPAAMLTGPAARNDTAVMASQRDAVKNDPDTLAVYDALTRVAMKLAGHHSAAVNNAHIRRRHELED